MVRLSRYGSYALIALGWMFFSVIIPSASGPSDAAPRERLAAPRLAGSVGPAPLMIGSPRQGPLPVIAEPSAAPTVGPALVAIEPLPAEILPPAPPPGPALPAS